MSDHNTTQKTQLYVAVLTGLFALASAGFSAWSSIRANDATTELETYKVNTLQLQNFAERVEESVNTLSSASDTKSQVAGTIDIFSLYSLSKGVPEEKRALIYVAAASNNTMLLRLLATYLKKSPDPEDTSLQTELAEAISDKLNSVDTASATTGRNVVTADSAKQNSVEATAIAVLGSVTKAGTQGWMFLGNSASNAPGSPLEFALVAPASVPQKNSSSARAAQYVHLRDPNVTPAGDAPLGGIEGVIPPGRHIHIVDLTFVRISGGANPRFAAWAKVNLCPTTASAC